MTIEEFRKRELAMMSKNITEDLTENEIKIPEEVKKEYLLFLQTCNNCPLIVLMNIGYCIPIGNSMYYYVIDFNGKGKETNFLDDIYKDAVIIKYYSKDEFLELCTS